MQVLVPMNTTALGVSELNRLLQDVLNPASDMKQEHTSGATVFREGDKIMQIRNNYKIEWKKPGRNGQYEEGIGVFNGDFGTIIRLIPHEKTAIIGFDDGRIAEYAYAQFEELDLAYCITIHKSQGSEFHTVILPLAGGPVPLLTRNLLYTAVTRAKKLVYCIGRRETVARMVFHAQKNERNTGLKQRLQEYKRIS